jgi:ABC-type transport system involved in cytochrome bd biosynthesis fused ATPase/permease subunit
VKELENVMSKHLPSPTTLNTTTDFSTDTLLKQQEHQQEKGSTIQWIGHNSHLQQGTMPATALLRQLYANRESVIRATSRPVGSSGIYSGK